MRVMGRFSPPPIRHNIQLANIGLIFEYTKYSEHYYQHFMNNLAILGNADVQPEIPRRNVQNGEK